MANTMKHTPAPWIADNGDSELWGIFQKQDCNGIAYLCEPNGELLRENEAEANAHLIAAAPELLEACKQALRTLEARGVDIYSDPRYLLVKQAIAKAEGQK